MTFLVDEDVPVKLLTALRAAGHDALRVDPGTADRALAERAARERRVLILLRRGGSVRLEA